MQQLYQKIMLCRIIGLNAPYIAYCKAYGTYKCCYYADRHTHRKYIGENFRHLLILR